MAVPTGSIVWSMTLTPPDGYLLCDGAEVTESAHPGLHTHLTNAGNPFGTANGNPKLPDLITDNKFIRGAGGSVGVGSTALSAIVDHSHNINPSAQPGGPGISNQPGGGAGSHFVQFFPGFSSGENSGGSGEARPINVGLLPIIAT